MDNLSKQAAKVIMDFAEVRMKHGEQAIWPAFWGHTGSGKTTMARELAKETDRELITLLLHSMQPEDVLGLPSLGRGPVEWRQSEWVVTASQKPTLILLDEIDKARPEVIATVLTALASHEVRGTMFHPRTAFILAGQPVPPDQFLADATGEALSARVSWLPVHYDWNSLSNHLAVNLGWLPAQEIPALPILPRPSPRHISWSIDWIRKTRPEKELKYLVLSGIFPKEAVEKIIETSENINTELMAAKDLVEVLVEDLERIMKSTKGFKPEEVEKIQLTSLAAKLPLVALGKVMADVWHHGSIDLLCLALKRLWTEGDPEMVYGAMSNSVSELSNRATSGGGEINVLGTATEDQVLAALENTAAQIADIYVKRNEQKGAKEKEEKKSKGKK